MSNAIETLTAMVPDPPFTGSAEVTRAELLLTLTGPLSHHDPAVTDGSNTLLFNRQKQIHRRESVNRTPDQSKVDALAGLLPVPADIVPIVEGLDFPSFVACGLVAAFLDLYNAGDGAGIFTGMERYTRLETRVRLAAVRSKSLRQWWDRLTTDLHVPIHGGSGDDRLLRLLQPQAAIRDGALAALALDYRSIISIARLWHDTGKKQSALYAEKAGVDQSAASVVLSFDAAAIATSESVVTDIEVPAVQGNSIRHQIVRAPGWLHLCRMLGIDSGYPGEGGLPAGVEAIFENGGNIAGGAKQPSNPHALAWAVRRRYPLLDLVGGCLDAHDLGESRLKPSGWLVCRENRDALGDLDSLNRHLSAFDMLTEVTQTRQASSQGRGQMIYTCEALATGTQLLVRLTLDAFTPDLTKGALVAAVETYLENPKLGGQSRAGFGSVAGQWLKEIPNAAHLRAAYESYLTENRESLVAMMQTGTMGAGVRVLS